MMNTLLRKILVNDCFGVSKVVTSTWDKNEEKEHGKPPKNSKIWNCEHCRTKTIPKHKNNSSSNWALVDKLFPIGHERWERFGRPVDGYHKLNDRQMVHWEWLGTKGSCFCVIQLQGMKIGFTLRIPSAKIVGRFRRTIHIDRKTESHWQKDDALVWWDQRNVVSDELLKSGETVNTKRYRQQLTDLNEFF